MGVRRVALEVFAAVAGADSAGFDVALVAPAVPPGCAKTFKDVELVDIYDRPAALEAAVRLAKRTSAVGVVSWTDIGVELAARLAARCGFLAPSADAARRARNKHDMRRAMLPHPELIPRFRHVTSLTDLMAAYDEIGTPALLKPAGGSGSRSIIQIGSDADLASIFAQAQELTRPQVAKLFADYAGEFVYEERLGGSEHSVEGVVHNGVPHIAGITDKWVHEPYYVEYEQMHPSVLPSNIQATVHDLARKVVGAVGIDACAFHLECRVLPDGSAKLLEIAARPGGGYITSHLIPLSTGIPFHANLVRVATGQAPISLHTQSMYAGSRGILSTVPGKFIGFDGLAQTLDLWGVEHFVMEREIGGNVTLPPGETLSAVLGYVVARGGDYNDVRKVMQQAVDLSGPRVVQGA